jgi:hypothetical protein
LLTSVPARGKERVQLLRGLYTLVAELTNEGAEHALKCLLVSILEVEVEVEERLRSYGAVKILNNCGAENRLATSRNAVKPQKRISPRLPVCKGITF